MPEEGDAKESTFVVEKVAITTLRSVLTANETALVEAAEDKKATLNKGEILKLMTGICSLRRL